MNEFLEKIKDKIKKDMTQLVDDNSLFFKISTQIGMDRFVEEQSEIKRKQFYGSTEPTVIGNLIILATADSKAEIIFSRILKENDIDFKFQYTIGKYRVDYIINGFLVFELDGPHHLAQKEYDAKRDKYIESLGYKVVRMPLVYLVMDIDGVIKEIKDVFAKFRARNKDNIVT